MRHSSIRVRNCATALLMAGSLVALTGCSDSGGEAASPKSPTGALPGSSSSASPTATADKATVLAVYRKSWDASVAAYAKASSAGTDLRTTTTARALLDIESDLKELRKGGQITTGRPSIHPGDPKITAGEFPKATLTDCVDITRWTLVDKNSKKKVRLPSGRLLRYVSIATLEKWGPKWKVTKMTAQQKAC
ncbi:hypothetical protein [Streptomyces sp. NBC_00687]|uniref:hypothetical protein n=1 Tax=Streptomyces sp. NBC_00687 TaxID=2975807 RepID=UPI0022594008|nr:hypothetical protein [Streptomyces sp. NBC_00687]MCX4919896.1 hypothetical protein [Streptomyces sp. NBC_00687]